MANLHRNAILLSAAILAWIVPSIATAQNGKELTNSIGMRLGRVEPGSFTMGFTGAPLTADVAGQPFRANGDFDEYPAHTVRIGTAFYVGAFEVTNAQYEQFDPAHRTLRGKLGFASEGDDA